MSNGLRAAATARVVALQSEGDPGLAALAARAIDPTLSADDRERADAALIAAQKALGAQRRGETVDPDVWEASALKAADTGERDRRVGIVLKAYTAADLMRAKFPVREPLLYHGEVVGIRAGHIGQITAPTGVGKTWFLLSLAIAAAAGSVRVLGWISVRPIRVLYIDGEMHSESLRGRVRTLCGMFGLDVEVLTSLVLLGADWQADFLPRLDTTDGQDAVEPFVCAADLIVLDNRSCLFDTEGEKDPTAWGPAQDWLLSLRRRGKAVLMAHHAGRNGAARGLSKPEDAMDLHVLLTRPEGAQGGATFTTDWRKYREFERQPEPETWTLTAEGWRLADDASGPGRTPWEIVKDKVLTAVADAGPAGASKRSIRENVTGTRNSSKDGALDELRAEGRIRPLDSGAFVVVR